MQSQDGGRSIWNGTCSNIDVTRSDIAVRFNITKEVPDEMLR